MTRLRSRGHYVAQTPARQSCSGTERRSETSARIGGTDGGSGTSWGLPARGGAKMGVGGTDRRVVHAPRICQCQRMRLELPQSFWDRVWRWNCESSSDGACRGKVRVRIQRQPTFAESARAWHLDQAVPCITSPRLTISYFFTNPRP